MCQPANSPDLNVLDLGVFSSIQSIQYRVPRKNIEELIEAVYVAFAELDRCTLNNIFLTLQHCMICIMKNDGNIDYKIPHMGKAKLARAGQLPETLPCDPAIYNHAVGVLASARRPSVALLV
jgi:hypothetical protein